MKMRAAVLEEFGKPLEVQELELADPRPGEVLVRPQACGVAIPTSIRRRGRTSGYSPTVLGHEGAGVVEKVGSDVSELAEGDHVVTLFSARCREGPTASTSAPTSASRSATSRTRASCLTAARGSRATERRCATSWAARPSRSTR